MAQAKRDGCAQRELRWSKKQRAEYERDIASQLGGEMRRLLVRGIGPAELNRVADVLAQGNQEALARELSLWTVRLARAQAQAQDELRRGELAFELGGQVQFQIARCRRIADRYEAREGSQVAEMAVATKGARNAS